jgi:PAS domain S-box-containing protein
MDETNQEVLAVASEAENGDAPYPGRERRRPRPETPIGYIQGLPAKVVLDRLPVPVLVVHEDGTVVYANLAFEELLGYERHDMTDRAAEVIFTDLGADTSATSLLRQKAGSVVELAHTDGSAVRAVVSDSALLRDDDPVVLVAFHDVTEQLWAHGRVE